MFMLRNFRNVDCDTNRKAIIIGTLYSYSIYGYINIILLSVASVILAEIVTEEVHNYKLSMIALNMICILNISTYYIYRKIAENHKRDLQRTILIQEKIRWILINLK